MKKILIIEDEHELIEGLTSLLKYEGYKILISSTGEHGIKLAEQEIPDIILCDIIMPGINGFEVLSRLKNNTLTSLIPFIFITAIDQKEKQRKGMELGADDFIIKPFTREELLNTLKARLLKQDAIEKKIINLKKSIIYSIPHELKNPLNAIIGFAHIIKEKAGILPISEISQIGDYIYQSGNILNDIIQKYLIFIDIEINKTSKKSLLATDISIKIENIVKTLAQYYNRTHDYTLHLVNCKIKIIPDWFFLGIKELIDNAFKFSKQGQQISVCSKINNNHYFLTICDKGIGFSSHTINKIGILTQFDRKKHEQQGTGMGLYLAKKIIKIHNGSFTIHSSPGKGTKISIRLPCFQ